MREKLVTVEKAGELIPIIFKCRSISYRNKNKWEMPPEIVPDPLET
jgi:hypothetical protein